MARKDRYTPTKRRLRPHTRRERIIVPQPVERPLHLKTRDLLQREEFDRDPWWFIKHRRGVQRPKVGQDPLEARAVSESTVKGTLPERIVYKYLLFPMRMSPGIDFSFQTSLHGGRLELGGIVADFIFDPRNMIIQVQGPTHRGFLRAAKDEEQASLLADMGYNVYYLNVQKDIYDERRFNDVMRIIFNYPGADMTGVVETTYSRSVDITRDVDDILDRIEDKLRNA